MWAYVGAIGVASDRASDAQAEYAREFNRALQGLRPGAVIPVSHPGAVQFLPRPEQSGDCHGCGAPLKAYIHHCEYCRREKC